MGVVEETAEDRRIRGALPTLSAAGVVLYVVIAVVVGGAVVGILDGDVRSGVIFGVLMAIVLIGQGLWRRRQNSSRRRLG
ncbi:MAG: hypothetical protein WAU75_21330 [Solirubrobacteraceae bacterium]